MRRRVLLSPRLPVRRRVLLSPRPAITVSAPTKTRPTRAAITSSNAQPLLPAQIGPAAGVSSSCPGFLSRFAFRSTFLVQFVVPTSVLRCDGVRLVCLIFLTLPPVSVSWFLIRHPAPAFCLTFFFSYLSHHLLVVRHIPRARLPRLNANPLPSREVEPHGSGGSTPCPLALLRADSHSGSCTARFLLSKDVARSVVEHRPALGEAALSIIDFPPETGQCAGARDHRPALGDLLLLERGIGRFLCTTSRLGRDWLVRTGNGRGVSAGRGVGPSRRLSQGGILRGPISPEQGRCS